MKRQIRLIFSKIKRTSIFVLYTLFMLINISFISHGEPEKQAISEEKTVRVGFYPLAGFQEYDQDGNPYGYNVSYMEKIVQQTGWKIEYIPIERWSKALDALEAGEIDLIGGAQMSPERAMRFDYGSYTGGSAFGAILTLKDNEEIAYEDFVLLGSLRIGCVNEYVRQDEFKDYAQNNGFTPQLTYYDNTSEMRQAMEDGEIDAMVCSVMEITSNEKVVGRFAYAPFYYIVKKGNDSLRHELDEAMAFIKLYDFNLEERLFAQYYPNSTTVDFNREELEYIAKSKPIVISYMNESSPLSYFNEEGQIAGILPEFIKQIEVESGLDFVEKGITKERGIKEVPDLYQTNMVAGMIYSDYNLEREDLLLSVPFFESEFICLARRGAFFNDEMELTVAIPEGLEAITREVEIQYPKFVIKNFTTTQECLEAVLEEKADLVLQNRHVLNEFLSRPQYEGLELIPGTGIPERLCFGFNRNTDAILVSIINKSIARIPTEFSSQILINYTFGKVYVPTISDFWLQYQIPIIIVAVALILLLLAVIYICMQRQKHYILMQSSEHRLQYITDNINGGVIVITTDNQMKILYANVGLMELLGLTDSTAIKNRSFNILISPEEKKELFGQDVNLSERRVSIELSIQHAKGYFVPVLLKGTISKEDNMQFLLYCAVVDISRQRGMIAELEAEKERSDLLIELSDSIFFEIGFRDNNIRTSPMFLRKFGWNLPEDDNYMECFQKHVHPEDEYFEFIKEEIRNKKRNSTFDLRMKKEDGNYIWCRFTLGYFYEQGNLSRLVGKIEDIDNDVREKKYLEAISMKDPLTGLNNREGFQRQIEAFVAGRKVSKGLSGAVLYFIDLDNFKKVNDSFGHSVGDEALIESAEAIKALFRRDDVVGRFGGDEFYVFAGVLPSAQIEKKAKQICEVCKKIYYDDSGTEIKLSASVGVAVYPQDGSNIETLIEKADMALYYAKRHGKDASAIYSQIQDC